jgi:hypothetical protein
MVLAGEGAALRFDLSLVRSVARARRWRRQIETGQLPSIGAIARNEHIAARYVRDGRILYGQPKIRRWMCAGEPSSRLAVQHRQLLAQDEYFGLARAADIERSTSSNRITNANIAMVQLAHLPGFVTRTKF